MIAILAVLATLGSTGTARAGSSASPATQEIVPTNPFVILEERPVDYSGHYQVELQNMDARGNVNTFVWRPPASLAVTAVTDVEGGSCTLNADGTVGCTTNLTTPDCIRSKRGGTTCKPSPGGSMTFDFSAQLTGTLPGASFTQNLFTGTYQYQLQITGMAITPQV